MWNDIDLYHAVRDFTTDPVSFPVSEVKAFTDQLVSPFPRRIISRTTYLSSSSARLPIINDVGRAPGSTGSMVSVNGCTKYTTDIPIVDAAVAKQVNATDLVRFHLHRTGKIN
jgi:hypothetical protein